MAAALLVLFVLLLIALTRRAGWWVALALAAPLLLTVDFWDVPGSIPHGVSMAVAVGGSLLALSRARSDDPWSWAAWPLVAGCAYNFVDLMTNPPLAWCLCTFVVGVAVFVETSSARRTLLASGVAASAWIAGYAGTWAVLVIVDILAFGWHVTDTFVLNEIAFRGGGSASSWQVIRYVWQVWSGQVDYRSFEVATVLVAVVAILVARRRFSAFGALAWPALLVFLWFSIVREQSFHHAFFTYRSLGMALAVIAAGVTCATWSSPRGAEPRYPLPPRLMVRDS